jgi:hypothetical protein
LVVNPGRRHELCTVNRSPLLRASESSGRFNTSTSTRSLITDDAEWSALREAHYNALMEYTATAERVAARLKTHIAPTAEEFEAEETARAKLFDVRRRILDLRYRQSAKS